MQSGKLMMAGVAAAARVADRRERLETFREALGVVSFVGIARHPVSVTPPNMAYQPYMALSLVAPLM